MKTIKLITNRLKKLVHFAVYRGSCPKCGGFMDSDDDCCSTCGYPDSD